MNYPFQGMPSTREKDYVNNYINTADMCMQGLCFTPDYVIMTAYTEDKNEPGALMVFDRETGDYLVTLGMKKDSLLAASLLTEKIYGYVTLIPIH